MPGRSGCTPRSVLLSHSASLSNSKILEDDIVQQTSKHEMNDLVPEERIKRDAFSNFSTPKIPLRDQMACSENSASGSEPDTEIAVLDSIYPFV